MPQKTYAERPMTQAEKYRTLKPSHDYVYREQYLMQKYGSVYKTWISIIYSKIYFVQN